MASCTLAGEALATRMCSVCAPGSDLPPSCALVCIERLLCSGDCHVHKWHASSGLCAAMFQSGHTSVITCLLCDDSDGMGGRLPPRQQLLVSGSVKGRLRRARGLPVVSSGA